MKKAVLFDLDATLVQFDQKTFEYEYFKRVAKLGYNTDQFITQLNKAVKAMYKNDGTRTNEQVFIDCLKEIYSDSDFENINQAFTDFYNNNYDNMEEIVTPSPEIKNIINWCKQNFEYVLLTTNPFFPKFAVQKRLDWTKSGLTLNDFDLVTTYETSNFSKPNPKYYEMVLNKFNLTPADCIMVGNNELEDYFTAKTMGMDAYLVGNYVMPYNEATNHPAIVQFSNLIETLKIAKQK